MNNEARHWRRKAGAEDRGLRLDAFWARELEGEGISREKVKEWIRAGRASMDLLLVFKPGVKVGEGALLELAGEAPAPVVAAEDGPLDVLHEDAQVIVLNKPAGLTTHPAPSQPSGTLVNRLLHRYPELAALDPERPGIVHRLDKDTSGVMVVARTEKARLRLAEDFAERRVYKLYLALAHGVPDETETEIDLPMGRDPRVKTRMAVVNKGGRPAKTRVKVLWHDEAERMSLLAVRILTGRTHQVRVHLGALEHPLLGDVTYGPRRHGQWQREAGPAANLCVRQMLHAFVLRFDHPETGERMHFSCPPPEDFMRLLAACHERCLRVGLTGAAGSGKSSLLRALAGLGVPTFSADACVAELYAPGGDGAQVLAARFGSRFMAGAGGGSEGSEAGPEAGVDKPALLAAMRADDGLRREVMEAIHPLVRHRMETFFAEHASAGAAVAEVPLLLESGWRSARGEDGPQAPGVPAFDVVVGVRCPDERRAGELAAARGLDPEVLAAFDAWQWPQEKKLAACDEVVDNSGSLEDLERGARELLERLRARSAAREAAFAAHVEGLLAAVREAGA
ncbi:MAG: dephospho-CoA kinase [Desulfovibrionaceae bacterium]